MVLGFLTAVIMTGVGVAAPGGTPSAPAPGSAESRPLQPIVEDTRKNLQNAFGNEMNTRARYLEAARVADDEGYRYVAQLFRACARAEQAHADEHVHAIAWSGDEARVLLDRMILGTTVENLRSAIHLETYEATERYPALLARARAEHRPEAVRSMNFALAAEREHARLFTSALASLDQRLPARTLYVCARCGKTVEALDFKKCPNCFTPARRFERVD